MDREAQVERPRWDRVPHELDELVTRTDPERAVEDAPTRFLIAQLVVPGEADAIWLELFRDSSGWLVSPRSHRRRETPERRPVVNGVPRIAQPENQLFRHWAPVPSRAESS